MSKEVKEALILAGVYIGCVTLVIGFAIGWCMRGIHDRKQEPKRRAGMIR